MTTVAPRFKVKYKEQVIAKLQEEFGYKNHMEIPRLEKIVLSQGIGKAVADKRLVDNALEEIGLITGQKPVATVSKKDVANFKLRKGMPIGAKVTLRGERMYEFFDRFLSVALPRTRDFRGVNPKGFDGRGNFNMGITEQIIFPELNIDKIKNITGMDITFVTSANTDAEAKALLLAFGFPFAKK